MKQIHTQLNTDTGIFLIQVCMKICTFMQSNYFSSALYFGLLTPPAFHQDHLQLN